MSDTLIADTADRLMTEVAPASIVRGLKDRSTATTTWAALSESGFLDALVPESEGGAGLTPADTLPVLLASGRHALPLPLGTTMAARAMVVAAGHPAPDGMIALASSARREAGGWMTQVPAGEFADWIVVQDGDEALVLPAATAASEPTGEGSVCRMRWTNAEGIRIHGRDLLAIGARIEAAEMAGAMAAMFTTTLTYANDRAQFGRPIGKFQAVQQQLAVMTELVHSARASVELAARSSGVEAIAAAKVTVGEGAPQVVAIAHAVHGAIGVTEELDLHLLSDRLRRGRLRYGSERYWAERLGAAALDAGEPMLLDFVRKRIFA